MPMSEQSRRYYAAKAQWQREEREWRGYEEHREAWKKAHPEQRLSWKFWQR